MTDMLKTLLLVCLLRLPATAADTVQPAVIPPEAEVSASSGPVKLTLRVYKKKFKKDDRLWFQIELKNNGNAPFRFDEGFFPHPSRMRLNASLKKGVYLEISNRAGERLPSAEPLGGDCDAYAAPLIETHLIKYDKEDSAHLTSKQVELMRQGLSREQVRERMDEIKNTLLPKYLPPEPPGRQAQEYELKPGQSLTTPAWACGKYPEARKRFPKPIGQYAQYWDMPAYEYGPEYYVRVVYDAKPSEEVRKELREMGILPRPDDVRFKTPAIRVRMMK